MSDCYFPTVNGVSASVGTLTGSLGETGHPVFLLVPAVESGLRNSLLPDDCLSRPAENLILARTASMVLPQLRDNRIGLFWPLKIWRELEEFQPQIIHIHTPGSLGFAAMIWARFKGLPYVFSHHTLFEEYLTYFPFSENLSRLLVLKWIRMFWQGAEAVIAPSFSIKGRIRLQGCRKDIYVIPTGINTEEFREGREDIFKEELGLREKPFIYVGRLAYEKSIDFILKALALLKVRGISAKLALIGGGPAEQSLRKMAEKLGIAENVFFLGWRRREELRHYYASAQALLFASETETQGLAAAEAESCALPAIAVESSGISEAVPLSSPLTVKPGDLEGFAQRIELLMNDTELSHRLGREAREHVRDHFSVQKMRQAALNMYNNIFARSQNNI
ncbi:glycosyltransferase [bacterium]|nr:glycosyltransferase [bacterium]